MQRSEATLGSEVALERAGSDMTIRNTDTAKVTIKRIYINSTNCSDINISDIQKYEIMNLNSPHINAIRTLCSLYHCYS